MRLKLAGICICFCLGLSHLLIAEAQFHSTIPVVDMRDFCDPEKKAHFVQQVSEALQKVGFFAVINPGIDQAALTKAYEASREFFRASQELKNHIYDPKNNGQRGYVPSETAQGHDNKDYKEFLHIGRGSNLWPKWMQLEVPMMNLISTLDTHSELLQRAFALAIGEEENYFVNTTKNGECLLRALYYPRNPASNMHWAAPHTDIDLFTILPMATEDGLQLFHNEQWIDVRVPKDAFIVNGGDKLQNLTNGYFKSALHRVVSKQPVDRYSIVYFVHSRLSDSMSPTPRCIQLTGGVQRYPDATSLELLASRLRELGLASPVLLEYEQESGIMERTRRLVESGAAATPVQATYAEWIRSKKGENRITAK